MHCADQPAHNPCVNDLRIYIDPAALLVPAPSKLDWRDYRRADVLLGGDSVLGKALPIAVSAALVTALRAAVCGHKVTWLTTLAADPEFCHGVIRELGWPEPSLVDFRHLAYETDPAGIDLWLPRIVAEDVRSGASLVWISEDAVTYESWPRAQLPDGVGLLTIAPNPEHGLAREQIKEVGAFVSANTGD